MKMEWIEKHWPEDDATKAEEWIIEAICLYFLHLVPFDRTTPDDILCYCSAA